MTRTTGLIFISSATDEYHHACNVPLPKMKWHRGDGAVPDLDLTKCKSCGGFFYPEKTEKLCPNCQNDPAVEKAQKQLENKAYANAWAKTLNQRGKVRDYLKDPESDFDE